MSENLKILDYIKNHPGVNLDSIFKNNKATEVTIKKILLDFLEKEYIYLNNKKYFEKSYQLDKQKSICEIDEDTFFGVKIETEQKNKIKYLYKKIIEYWVKNKKINPKTIQLYKIVVEINKKLNLNLPIVWYKFGQIPIVGYNHQNKEQLEINTNYSNIISDKKINDIVIENMQFNSRKMKLNQYHSGQTAYHIIYSIKEEIIENYYKNNFKFIKDNFDILLEKIPYYNDKNKTIDKFYNFLYEYNKLNLNIQTKNKTKDLFYKLFNKFWDIIAIFNFVNSLKEYYIENNLDYNIKDYINPQLKEEIFEFNTLLNNFYDIYNSKKEDSLLKLLLDKK